MAKNYLDKTGLALVWEKIKNLLNTKVDKVDGKGLSTNDYTTNEKTKLAGIASGAQVNVLEGIQKNGATITPVNKIANITINKSDVGLDNVDNTSDVNKPISTATQTALDNKADKSATVSNVAYDSTNKKITKTINGTTSDVVTVATLKTALNLAKGDVGLGNVDNTADANKNVLSATKLTTARTIDGVSFNGSANIVHYGTCGTAAATTAKVVDCTGFTLATGAWIAIKFTVTNTGAVGSLTLNVNGTGAKSIKYRGGNLPSAGTLTTGRTYLFVYDGTNYELIGDLDTNSTYTAASAAPLMDGTATVGSSVKYAREDHVHPSDTSRVSTSTTVNGKPLSSNITLSASDVSAIPTSAKGVANGVCPLNSSSKIDSTYLPSFVDDVVEAYARSGQTALSSTWLATGSASGTVITPQSGVIYVLMADSGDYTANSQFRWSGTSYVKLNDGGVSPITEAEINIICA